MKLADYKICLFKKSHVETSRTPRAASSAARESHEETPGRKRSGGGMNGERHILLMFQQPTRKLGRLSQSHIRWI